jgi:glucose/arabinose dehydrogenase
MKRGLPLRPRRWALIPTLVVTWCACVESPPPPTSQSCDAGNGGITLPDGFCALVVTDSLGPARHLAVTPNGDIFVALRNTFGPERKLLPGGVVVLRDVDGDGRADERHSWGENGGNEVLLDDGYVYFATDDAVLRYPLPSGSPIRSGPPDTLVKGLPATDNHRAKSLALASGNALFVKIVSPSNACQEEPRSVGSPGLDPFRQLDKRAGIWRFDAERTGQTQEDGVRFATGLRNTVALRTHPSGALYGIVHGRGQLSALWSEYFTEEEGAEKPAEEFVLIEEGDDFGWPYCYYDPTPDRKVLAPEYGGEGEISGRCAEMKDPLIDFPAHWAPNDLESYTGTQFPSEYRGGAFIAFHGSWNRAPMPQAGHNVVFAPFEGNEPTGRWTVFAEGFPGGDVSPGGAAHRPVGLAEGPDGSLYVSDSWIGRIWKVMYVGG